jgi:hypothetical protein
MAGIRLPSGHVVGLDRAVRAARALAIRARRRVDLARDYAAPDPDAVEAGMRAASAEAEATPATPATWTVRKPELGPWEVRADGRLVDTCPGHYDAGTALEVTEQLAGRTLAWVLDPEDVDGFRSVVPAPDHPLTRADAERLTDLARAALAAEGVHAQAVGRHGPCSAATDRYRVTAGEARRELLDSIRALAGMDAER